MYDTIKLSTPMLKKYPIKKLYNGFASVRSNIVEETAKKGDDLLIIYERQYMVVENKVLKNPVRFQIHKQKFKSQYKKGQTYSLYDFLFVPDKVVQPKLL